LKRGPTRFDLAPTYLIRNRESGLRSSFDENVLSVFDFFSFEDFLYMFDFSGISVFFIKLHFGYRLTRMAL